MSDSTPIPAWVVLIAKVACYLIVAVCAALELYNHI